MKKHRLSFLPSLIIVLSNYVADVVYLVCVTISWRRSNSSTYLVCFR